MGLTMADMASSQGLGGWAAYRHLPIEAIGLFISQVKERERRTVRRNLGPRCGGAGDWSLSDDYKLARLLAGAASPL
jgi:hypothetical protein